MEFAQKTENAYVNPDTLEKPATFSNAKMNVPHMDFAKRENASVKKDGEANSAKNA